MTAFVFGSPSDLSQHFFILFLLGVLLGGAVYATCAFPRLRNRNLRNSPPFKKLGRFLWAAILGVFLIIGYWSASRQFTILEYREGEITLQYHWPARTKTVKCPDLQFVDYLSAAKTARRQLVLGARDGSQFKSMDLPRQDFIPLYEELQQTVCQE